MSSEYSKMSSSDDEFNDTVEIKDVIKKKNKKTFKNKKNKKCKMENYIEVLEKRYGNSKGVGNSLKIKKTDGGFFNITILGTGDEFFIVQKYKVSDMMEVASDQRWKTSTITLKIALNTKNKKDEAILNGFENVINMSMEKFMSDPEKQINGYK